MKHTILPGAFILMLVMFISSCTKDEAVPVISTSQVNNDAPILLSARAWSADQSGRFVCKFTNFMHSSSSATGVTNAKVYLLTGSDELMISFGPVTYMSGQVWSEQEGHDLSVYYEPFASQTVLPFEKLDLKIER